MKNKQLSPKERYDALLKARDEKQESAKYERDNRERLFEEEFAKLRKQVKAIRDKDFPKSPHSESAHDFSMELENVRFYVGRNSNDLIICTWLGKIDHKVNDPLGDDDRISFNIEGKSVSWGAEKKTSKELANYLVDKLVSQLEILFQKEGRKALPK